MPRAGIPREAAQNGDSALAQAVQEVAVEVRALRDTVAAANGFVARQGLGRVLHDLAESLNEMQADNEALQLENERLMATQEQIDHLLEEARAPARLLELADENVRLRQELAQTRAEASHAHSMLLAITGSRAWKVMNLYWAFARRLGRGRSPRTPG
jgi:predicted nuclease with TOPRIM domain